MGSDAPTVASWFSGVGGLDMGLERAGFRIVSHSEIEPHACAVLARHWPHVPNLGDISALGVRHQRLGEQSTGPDDDGPDEGRREDWQTADVWAGGPPCQGFSIAGQRRGLDDHRSSLALTWLDLVGRYRPGALLFENVPGILSSAHGLDWYALLRELGHLGFWWAYRVLDAQWFGVPQRRRRVFLVALDAGRYPDSDGPGQVLAVGTRCGRDHAAEREAWAAAAGRAGRGAGIVDQAITAKWSKQPSGPAGDEHHHLVVGTLHAGMRKHGGQDDDGRFLVVDRAPHHPGGGRAPDGLAGRPHDRVFVKAQRAHHADDCERWELGTVSPSIDAGGQALRTATLVAATLNSGGNDGGFRTEPGEHIVSGHYGIADDPLLPLGQDSKRYRVIGNGVATPCAEWIGHRLMAYMWP